VGAQLDAEVPRLEGGVLALADLRGYVVLLEIGSAEDPAWPRAQARWQALASAHLEQLRIVSVVADEDPTRAQWTWDAVPTALVCGWDPQGALGARLGATRFPTRWVVDTQGRVVATIVGSDVASEDRVEQVIGQQLRSSPRPEDGSD